MDQVTPPTAPSFASLLEAARAGSTEARGVLLRRFERCLLRRAQSSRPHIIWGKLGASDFVQDTFLHALQHLDHFSGETQAQFVAWLERILHRRLLNGVEQFHGTQKRAVSREMSIAELQAESAIVGRMEPASSKLDEDELESQVRSRLHQLSPEEREILTLKFRENRTVTEIAQLTGKSPAAIHKMRSRALRKLRQLFGEARTMCAAQLGVKADENLNESRADPP